MIKRPTTGKMEGKSVAKITDEENGEWRMKKSKDDVNPAVLQCGFGPSDLVSRKLPKRIKS